MMLYQVHFATDRNQTHNFSGDRHLLHTYMQTQQQYDNGYDSPRHKEVLKNILKSLLLVHRHVVSSNGKYIHTPPFLLQIQDHAESND